MKITAKKNSKKVIPKSRNTEKSNVITIKLSDRELKQLESLASLTNSNISQVVRACVKQSAGAIRKQYLKNFVARVEEMPDPFESDSPYYHQAAIEAAVDDSDQVLAEKISIQLSAAYEQGYQACEFDTMLDDMMNYHLGCDEAGH